MRQLFNASPKISGPSANFTLGKIWVNFLQLSTLIADIAGTSKEIQN